MKQTISVTKGKGSLNHNNREFITENVDSSLTSQNITYKKESLKEAYDKLFGEALANYNAKQKRSDRKIPDYIQHIKNSGNGEKLYYETIVQVGNKYTCGTLSKEGEIAKQILDKYMKDFERRNPNLYVFNSVLHLDETDGTPHLHIDWIPVAREYKQGMEVRNSLDKALKQQGIDGKSSKQQNSTQNWQNAEKDAVEKVMKEFGWERAAESGLHLEKRTLGQYKAEMREVENRVQNMPDHIPEEKKQAVPFNKDKVIVSKDDLEQLELRAKLSIVHEEASKALSEKLMSKVDQQINFNQDHQLRMLQLHQQLFEEKKQYEKKNTEAQAEWESYFGLYNEQVELNVSYNKLKFENNELKEEISTLGVKIKAQESEITDLKVETTKKVKEAVEAAEKPLKEQIKSLKSKGERVASSHATMLATIKFVAEKLVGGVAASILRAAYNLGDLILRNNGWKVDPPEHLLEVIRNRMDNVQLFYRVGLSGKGVYTESGVLLGNADSFNDAKALFPKATIVNEVKNKTKEWER